MPNRRISVFNPEGEQYVTESERFEEQKRQARNLDWMAMQALKARQQPQQRQAQPQQQSQGNGFSADDLMLAEMMRANRKAAGRPGQLQSEANALTDTYRQIRGGSADKNQFELDLQGAKDVPEMRKIDLIEREYGDQRADTAAQRQLDQYFTQKRMEAAPGVLSNPALQNSFVTGGLSGMGQKLGQLDDDNRARQAERERVTNAAGELIAQRGNPLQRGDELRRRGVTDPTARTAAQLSITPEERQRVVDQIGASPQVYDAIEEVGRISEEGLGPWSQDQYGQLQSELSKLGRLFQSGDVDYDTRVMLAEMLRKKLLEQVDSNYLIPAYGTADAERMIERELRALIGSR